MTRLLTPTDPAGRPVEPVAADVDLLDTAARYDEPMDRDVAP